MKMATKKPKTEDLRDFVDGLNLHFKPHYVLEQLKNELAVAAENPNLTNTDVKALCALILGRIEQLENEYGTYEAI